MFLETSFTHLVLMFVGVLFIVSFMVYLIDKFMKVLLFTSRGVLLSLLYVLTVLLSFTLNALGLLSSNILYYLKEVRLYFMYVQVKSMEIREATRTVGELQLCEEGLYVLTIHEGQELRVGLDSMKTLSMLSSLQPKVVPEVSKEMALSSPMHPITDVSQDGVAKSIIGLCTGLSDDKISAPFSTAFRVLVDGQTYLATSGHSYVELTKPQPTFLWSPVSGKCTPFVKNCKVIFYSDENGIDVALIAVPEVTFSVLGVKALKSEKVKLGVNNTVTVYGFSGKRLCSSTGVAHHSDRLVDEISYTASTVGGFSGGPVVSNGKVIAIHTSANKLTGFNSASSLPIRFLAFLRKDISRESYKQEEGWSWIDDDISGETPHVIKTRSSFGALTIHSYPGKKMFRVVKAEGYKDKLDVYEDLVEEGFLKEPEMVYPKHEKKSGFSLASSKASDQEDIKSSGILPVINSKKQKNLTGDSPKLSNKKKESITSENQLTALSQQLVKLQSIVEGLVNSAKVSQTILIQAEMPEHNMEVLETNPENSSSHTKILMIRFSRKQEKLFNRIFHHRRFQKGLRDPSRDSSQLRSSLVEYVTSSSGLLSQTPLLDFLSNNSL